MYSDRMRLIAVLNLHDAYGEDHCQRAYKDVAKAVGVDPATNATLPCTFENKALQVALHHYELESGENAGVDACKSTRGDQNMKLQLLLREHVSWTI